MSTKNGVFSEKKKRKKIAGSAGWKKAEKGRERRPVPALFLIVLLYVLKGAFQNRKPLVDLLIGDGEGRQEPQARSGGQR